MTWRTSVSCCCEALEPRTLLAAALFADLNEVGLNPGSFFNFGDKVVFAGDAPTQGRELYITDGTAAGTRLVADVNPGAAGSNPTPLFDSGTYLYFTANGGSGRSGLWKTDETAAGTTLVQPFEVGDYGGGAGSFAALSSGKVVFSTGEGLICDSPIGATDLQVGAKVEWNGWKPLEVAAVGSRGYLVVQTPQGQQLWQTNGTFRGTTPVNFKATTLSTLVSYGNQLYLVATARIGKGPLVHGLWKIKRDNRPVLLQRADDLEILPQNPHSSAFWFVTRGTDAKLWRLDLTGIHPVTTDPADVPTSTGPVSVTETGVFFAPVHYAETFNGIYSDDVWFCGNAAPAAVKLGSLPDEPVDYTSPTIERLAGSGDTVFIEVQQSNPDASNLWRATSTSSALTMMAPVGRAGVQYGTERLPTPANFAFAPASKQLVFSSPDPAAKQEIWTLAATANAVAQQMTETTGGPNDSGIANLTPFKNGLVFDTEVGVSSGQGYGTDVFAHSIWFTDGVSPPRLIARVLRHDSSYDGDGVGDNGSTMLATSGLVLFTQYDYDQANPYLADWSLWRTDGTAAGTYRFKTSLKEPRFIGQIGGKVIFAEHDYVAQSGYPLWVTDGTAAGTKHLKDLPNPASADSTFTAQSGVVFSSKLYFHLSGRLYRTDGTGTGTVDVTDKLQRTPLAQIYVGDLQLRGGTLLIGGAENEYGVDPELSAQATVWSLASGAAATAPRLVQAPVGQRFARLIVTPTGRTWLETDNSLDYTRQTLYDVPATPSSSATRAAFKAPGHFVKYVGSAGTNHYIITKTYTGKATLYVVDDALDNARAVAGLNLKDDQAFFYTAPLGGTLVGVQGTLDWGVLFRTQGAVLTRLADDFPKHEYQLNYVPEPHFTPVGNRLLFIATDALHGDELWSYTV
jgi:ELWxxDGT repeat protein